MLLRYDADPLAAAERSHEVVDNDTVDPCADKTDDHKTERIDEKSRATYHHPCDRHRHPHVEVKILVEDLGYYVKSPGRGIDAEQYRLRSAQHQHKTEKVKPQVSHHGSRPRLHQILIRADLLPQIHHGAQNQCGISRLDPELRPNQAIRHNKKYSIDYQNHSGNFDNNAHVGKHPAYDNRQAGDAAYHKFAGHKEIVYRSSSNKHGYGNREHVSPEFWSLDRGPKRSVFHYGRLLVCFSKILSGTFQIPVYRLCGPAPGSHGKYHRGGTCDGISTGKYPGTRRHARLIRHEAPATVGLKTRCSP